MSSAEFYKWAVVALLRNDELLKNQYSNILHKDNLYIFGLFIDDIFRGTFGFDEDNELQFKPISEIIIQGEVMKPIHLSVAICSKILKSDHPYLLKYLKKRKLVNSDVEAIYELYELYIYTLLYLNWKLLES